MELINACEERAKHHFVARTLFNWEGMLSIGYHLMGKGYGVYAPLSNKYFNQLISKSREKHKLICFRFEPWNLFAETKKKGTTPYGFINDQSPHAP